MLPQPQAGEYRDNLNTFLLRAVDAGAQRIIEVGCASGRLGGALKDARTDRHVVGVEIDEDAAAQARTRLDEVYVLDVDRDAPDLEPGTFDCITFGDVLEHLRDPEGALRRFAPLLRPGGEILVSLPNVQHYSVLQGLLRGDFMYRPDGLLDSTHLRFFTLRSFSKLLLDAGFLPEVVERVRSGMGEQFVRAATPVLQLSGVHPDATLESIDTFQYILRGRPLGLPTTPFADESITFVVCSNDVEQLENNLLRSPCLDPGTPHEVVVLRDQPSVGAALATARATARHDLVVLVHQDVYLPRGWDSQLVAQWHAAEAAHGPLGLAGAYGYREIDGEPQGVGRVVDRDQPLVRGGPLPAVVDGLDEIVLVLPRDSELEIDPALGFHLYGADLSLQARARGLPVVVLDLPCLHNSLFHAVDPAFHASREVLLATWPAVRPLVASMGRLDTMEVRAVPPTWFDEMQAQAERAPALDAEVVELRATLADRDQHVANMEASVFWRARNGLHRILHRG